MRKILPILCCIVITAMAMASCGDKGEFDFRTDAESFARGTFCISFNVTDAAADSLFGGRTSCVVARNQKDNGTFYFEIDDGAILMAQSKAFIVNTAEEMYDVWEGTSPSFDFLNTLFDLNVESVENSGDGSTTVRCKGPLGDAIIRYAGKKMTKIEFHGVPGLPDESDGILQIEVTGFSAELPDDVFFVFSADFAYVTGFASQDS